MNCVGRAVKFSYFIARSTVIRVLCPSGITRSTLGAFGSAVSGRFGPGICNSGRTRCELPHPPPRSRRGRRVEGRRSPPPGKTEPTATDTDPIKGLVALSRFYMALPATQDRGKILWPGCNPQSGRRTSVMAVADAYQVNRQRYLQTARDRTAYICAGRG